MGARKRMNNHIEILIAEDSPTQREQLKHLLEEEGYTVRAAGNGEEALESAKSRKPTLLISDVVMPRMDGYALCKEIKTRDGLKDIPVILVTGLSNPHDVIKGLESGADNFIRKPYEIRELLSRIAYILTNRYIRSESKVQGGVQIALGGRKYFITAERQQILDLLITTYDDAVSLNQHLVATQWEIARSNEVLRGLYRIANGLNRSVTVQEVLEESLSLSMELPGIRAAWVSLWDAKQGFRLAASRNLPPALESPGVWEGDCLCRRKMLAGELTEAVNYFECERLQRASGDTKGLRFHSSIPLKTGGRVLGVLNLAGPDEGKVNEEDLELWGGVGDQVALALERAQLLENLESKVAERTAALEAEFAERRKAQEALQKSETRFRRLVDSPMVGVVQEHADGRLLDANDVFLKMVGYTRQDLEAGRMKWMDMTPSEFRAQSERFISEVARGMVRAPIEKAYIRKDGSRVPALVGGAPVGDSLQEVICVVLDLSSQKILEEQLGQASKMEAIGRLAGGVAHDFNNLLTIINGYAQLLIERFPAGNPSHAPLEEILNAGSRAADLTRQLLAFGRRQVIAPQILNLNRVVSGIEKMIDRLIGEDIELVCRLKEPLSAVKADPGQIEQVVMNLVVNSRDAMPKGGKLTIETADVELDETYCRTHVGAAPGSYVMLAVSDTGVGMDKEAQSHIFEPFFTTKEKGKGTGLGLATVHGIVKQSGGHLGVYSEAGNGATFKVYLPRGKGDATSTRFSKKAKKVRGGSETILLVEDEEAVKALASQILQKQGYSVLATTCAEDALRISERHKGTIHLLLTDVVMPQISGRKVAELLAPRRPKMKVLYMSGYTDNAIVHHGILDADTAFLQKPFTPEALAFKVRKVLDSPS
jgi:PAS domain S-box-containing protein